MEEQPNHSYVLNLISQCEDVDRLATFIVNAQKRKVFVVREAAYRRLKSFIPKTIIKGIEQDFWIMFSAYEDLLLEYARPMTKLNGARRRMEEKGVIATLEFWVNHKSQAWAFEYFVKTGKENITAEALVSRYSDLFSKNVIETAQNCIAVVTSKNLELA